MKRFHLAIATDDIEGTIEDYSRRLGCAPCVVVPGEYALWRNAVINLSIRRDADHAPGTLRHLGWEDSEAARFTATTDVNGITWESFSPAQQAEEIEAAWPGTGYRPGSAAG